MAEVLTRWAAHSTSVGQLGPQRRFTDRPQLARRMSDEMNRLATFSKATDLPNSISSIDMAHEGFFYDSATTRIVCAFCEFRSEMPSKFEDLISDHQESSPMCPRVKEPSALARRLNGTLTNALQDRYQISTSANSLNDPEDTDDEDLYGSGPQMSGMSGSLPNLSLMNLYQGSSLPGNDVGRRGNTPSTSLGECSVPISSILSRVTGQRVPTTNASSPAYGRKAKIGDYESYDARPATFEQWPYASMPREEEPAGSFSSVQQARLPEGPTTQRQTTEYPSPVFDGSKAKVKGFETYGARLATFDAWPEDQRPRKEELADGGFLLVVDDLCQCFSCEVMLQKWKVDDDVWVEHAKHSPCCDFLLFRKGAEFVVSVLDDEDKERNMSPGPQVGPGNTERRDIHATSSPEAPTITEARQFPTNQHSGQERRADESSVGRKKDEGTQQSGGWIAPFDRRAVTSGGLPDPEIEKENEDLLERELCTLCFDKDRDTVFVPCHHLIACSTCAKKLRKCPICRERIVDCLAIYS